jgi:hypothetical protein
MQDLTNGRINTENLTADEWDTVLDGQYLGYVYDNGNRLLVFKVEAIKTDDR